MTREDDTRKEFEAFLDQLRSSATRPVDLPPDQREVFFRLVKANVFPAFPELGREVFRKGRPSPAGAATPVSYTHQTVDRGKTLAEWLSLSAHTLAAPRPVTIGDEVIGNEVCTIYVSDSVNTISFCVLEDGEVVVDNENRDNAKRVLNTPDSLFEEIPSHKLYPAGNAAAWINKIVERDMLDKTKAELEALPERR